MWILIIMLLLWIVVLTVIVVNNKSNIDELYEFSESADEALYRLLMDKAYELIDKKNELGKH